MIGLSEYQNKFFIIEFQAVYRLVLGLSLGLNHRQQGYFIDQTSISAVLNDIGNK